VFAFLLFSFFPFFSKEMKKSSKIDGTGKLPPVVKKKKTTTT